MLIGRGMIADRFCDYELQSQYMIFAGSVHDSTISDADIFAEEEKALKAALSKSGDIPCAYFSSCSILDPEVQGTPYVEHKIRMEKILQQSGRQFWIFRLPQLVGPTDVKSNVVNFFVDQIYTQKSFELEGQATHNFIDIDDVHVIASHIIKTGLKKNSIINVASSKQSALSDLVTSIEGALGLTAEYKTLDKGTGFAIDISEIEPLLETLEVSFDNAYLYRLVDKYYGHLVNGPKLLSVIVPTYNEEHGIDEFYRRTKRVLEKLAPRFSHEFIFVNDYSADKTLERLEALSRVDETVKVLNFSRNFGSQIGITAGIDFSKGDLAVVIDDDLQDPPEIIFNLLSKWDRGYKVVYGVRPNRKGVNPLFKLTAKLYYKVVRGLSEIEIPVDAGDFRLIDKVVIDVLRGMKEENRYYRGMVAWVGFPQAGVVYQRDARFQGVSTYSFRKYVTFAFSGITSFSERPLYVSSFMGLIITIVSFVFAVILILGKILDPSVAIPGWTSLAVIVLFFSGIQLLSIGVLGVYISKIYREVKGRPLYLIESSKNIGSEKSETTSFEK